MDNEAFKLEFLKRIDLLIERATTSPYPIVNYRHQEALKELKQKIEESPAETWWSWGDLVKAMFAKLKEEVVKDYVKEKRRGSRRSKR